MSVCFSVARPRSRGHCTPNATNTRPLTEQSFSSERVGFVFSFRSLFPSALDRRGFDKSSSAWALFFSMCCHSDRMQIWHCTDADCFRCREFLGPGLPSRRNRSSCCCLSIIPFFLVLYCIQDALSCLILVGLLLPGKMRSFVFPLHFSRGRCIGPFFFIIISPSFDP